MGASAISDGMPSCRSWRVSGSAPNDITVVAAEGKKLSSCVCCEHEEQAHRSRKGCVGLYARTCSACDTADAGQTSMAVLAGRL